MRTKNHYRFQNIIRRTVHNTLHLVSEAPLPLSVTARAGTIMTKAYVATSKGGDFAVIDVSSPKPKAGEVSIRNKAVALNPVDWKKHQFGIMVDSWPSIFGADIAGVVESVGDGVHDFSPGDEVFSLAGHENRAGGFQEVSTVPLHFVAHKPLSLSFEEAASLP